MMKSALIPKTNKLSLSNMLVKDRITNIIAFTNMLVTDRITNRSNFISRLTFIAIQLFKSIANRCLHSGIKYS